MISTKQCEPWKLIFKLGRTQIGPILFRASDVAESRGKLNIRERHVELRSIWQSHSSTSHQILVLWTKQLTYYGIRKYWSL
jgi:hypothetical protein